MENKDIKFTIDDTVEMNERLVGYHGFGIAFESGMSGHDFSDDLESIVQLSKVITEIINKKKRRKFKYFRREE